MSHGGPSLPGDTLWIFLALCFGFALGISIYTFLYARGYSYLSNDPTVCANCHVMNSQYDGWVKSTHHAVATCNDCHTPAPWLGKYAVKMRNGFWHSFYFTTGAFPDNIRITPSNRAVTEANCRRCHEDVVQAISGPHGRGLSCIQCHGSVGHP